jgi:hypothetical protein
MMRRSFFFLLALLVVLATAVVAAAANGKGETIQFNAADQAAARSATLRRSDLTPAGGWTGGRVKPDLSPPPSCPNYPVDLSRFVLTGTAASDWTRGTLELSSDTDVLKTAQMLRREWQIQVQASGAIACIRGQTAKAVAAEGGKLVSFKRIPFPHLATYSAAFRMVAEFTAGGDRVRLMREAALVGRSRTGVTVTVTGFASQQRAISAAALRSARILVGRIQA